MFTEASAARDYIFAGRGILTLRSTRTGAHFTFRVARPKDFTPTSPLFVSVLTTGGEYRYLGMLSAHREFRTTAKSCPARDAKAAAAFKFCVDALNKDRIPEMLEISHEGRCGCCGRLIITPSSLASGIGPECMENLGGKAPKLSRKATVRQPDPFLVAARERADREHAATNEFWRAYRAAPVSPLAGILERFAAAHC